MSVLSRIIDALVGPAPAPVQARAPRSDQDLMTSLWQNTLTGLGGETDKLSSHVPVSITPLSVDALASLYLGDPYAGRVVGAKIDDALRQGFDVGYGGGSDTDPDLIPKILERLDELDALGQVRRAAKWGALYGWGGLLLGTEQQDQSRQLVEEQSGELASLTVLDRRDVSVATWSEDGSHHELYRYQPVRGSSRLIHASHIIAFGGRDTALRDSIAYFDGFDCSVLQPVWEVIRAFQAGWQGANGMLIDGSIGVLKLPELARLLSMGGRSTLLERLAVMRQSLWSGKWLPIDSTESLEYVSRSFAGIPELLLEQKTLVAAAAEMPVTRLFGVSPAGLNATGASDEKSWHSTVEAERRNRITRQVRRLLLLVARELGAEEPEGFYPEWPALEVLNATEAAALELAIGQGDALRVQLGMAEETILRHRYGGATFQTTPPLLDDEELALLGEVTASSEPEPEPDAPQQ